MYEYMEEKTSKAKTLGPVATGHGDESAKGILIFLARLFVLNTIVPRRVEMTFSCLHHSTSS